MNRRARVWIGAMAGAVLAGAWVSGAPADERAYRAGVGLANKGANEQAVQELERYLSAEPEGANALAARYTLGVCLARMGKNEEAIRALDVVTERAGGKDFGYLNDARLLRAQSAMALGDFAGAANGLKKLVKDSPGFSGLDRATALYGEALYRQGRAGPARAALKGFGAKWPGSGEIDRAELISALADVMLGDHSQAAEKLEGLLKRSPDGPLAASAALALGQCRQSAGDSAGAREMLEKAARSADKSVSIDAGLALARLMRVGGDLAGADNAIGALDERGASDEQRAQIAFERGRLRFARGRAEEGRSIFEKLAEGGPEGQRNSALLWLARCEAQEGRFDAALKRLESLAGRTSEAGAAGMEAEVLFEIASVRSRAGDDAGAAENWKEWRQRFAGHALAGQAGAAHAAALYRLGRYDESLALCAALEGGGAGADGGAEALLLKGENQFFLERFEDALGTYERLLERFPEDAARGRIELRRGLCLVRLGRSEEASRVLSAALENGGDIEASLRVSAYAALGDLCVTKQEWACAEKWFARAVESASDKGPEGGSPDLLLRYGLAIEGKGDNAAAATMLERAWRAAAGSEIENRAAFEYARVLVKNGRGADARERLNAIVESEKGANEKPLTGPALRQLAALASSGGDAKGAAELLAKIDGPGTERGAVLLEQAGAWLAAGEYERAEKAAMEYLQGKPKGKNAALARARRAIAISRQGRHAEALRDLELLSSKSAMLDAQTLGAVRYEAALALRAAGRDEESRKAFEGLMEGEPGALIEAYAALELAQFAINAKRVEDAAGLLDRCVRAVAAISDGDAKPVREREAYLRGVMLSEAGEFARAADSLESFERDYPQSAMIASARLVRGEALAKSGRARDAAQVLERAANDPAIGANRSFALLKLGEASAGAQLWAESERAYGEYLSQSGAEKRSGDGVGALWFQARFGQGLARENMGNYEGAIEAYREVVDRHEGPTAARAQFQIGECLYAQKKLEDAVRELLKVDVLYGYPEWSSAALYEAARCLRELGRNKQAAEQFAEVVKRFPETRWATLASEAMNQESARTALESGEGR